MAHVAAAGASSAGAAGPSLQVQAGIVSPPALQQVDWPRGPEVVVAVMSSARP